MEEGEDSFEDARSDTVVTPLSGITEAFQDISNFLISQSTTCYKGEAGKEKEGAEKLRLDRFCEACTLVSILFGCLGLAFKFAELEYVAKVRGLVEASKKFKTLESILDLDIKNDTVKTPGSHSRNLRRVRQGLDLIRVLFEQFLSSNDNSLKEAASTAYSQVCAPFHTWAVRTAVAAGMYALPTRDQLLLKLNETEQSAEKNMRKYISVSGPIIAYIDKLYISRNISLDW